MQSPHAQTGAGPTRTPYRLPTAFPPPAKAAGKRGGVTAHPRILPPPGEWPRGERARRSARTHDASRGSILAGSPVGMGLCAFIERGGRIVRRLTQIDEALEMGFGRGGVWSRRVAVIDTPESRSAPESV